MFHWLYKILSRRYSGNVEEWPEPSRKRSILSSLMYPVKVSRPSAPARLESRGMSFTIYTASGGHILEYNSYDEKSDRSINNLYIITSDQDLGQAIAHAITIELLRN
jgi:hypothetical protein